MSRRKQGKPQRKTLDSLEQENDLLVCCDCQTNFPLCDIVNFIQHKVNRCNKIKGEVKETTDKDEGEDVSADESDEVYSDGISTRATSISAPISIKDVPESKASPQLESGDFTGIKLREKCEEEKKTESKPQQRSPLKQRQVVDADTNTTVSEPIRFECDSCKKAFSSAWLLLQHCQKEHHMRIYTPSSERSSHRHWDNEKAFGKESEKHPHHHGPSSGHSQQQSPRPSSRPNSSQSQKSRDDQRDTPMSVPSDSHRTPPSSSSMGSLDGGLLLPPHVSSHNPLGLLRYPFERTAPLFRAPGLDFSFPMESAMSRSGIFSLPPGGFEGIPPPFVNPYLDNRVRENSMFSNRLKELASGSQSPIRGGKHTPPFSQAGSTPSAFPTLTPPSTLDLEKHQQERSGSSTPPAKLKSCEFCGKSFRFQSNLIVHRRSHTGEKPFKCPVCPHACTQQSKLKRHMKTHNKSSQGQGSGLSNDGSMASGSSTPDSMKRTADDEDENDEEEEEEEEEIELEPEEDEETASELMEGSKKKNIEAPAAKCSELAARLMQSNTTEKGTSKEQETKDSLLLEVMKTSGLTNIQAYNDALKLAVASQLRKDSKPGSSSGGGDSQDEDKEESRKSKHVDDSESDSQPSKKIKSEPAEVFLPMSENSFFPIWHPYQERPLPTPENFPLQFPQGMRFDKTLDPNHNGYSPSTPESALKPMSSTPKPGPSTPMLESAQITRKDNGNSSKRNDTCEFCGKVFKNCSNLTVHRRSHTGEKPYKCVLCSYACAQSSKLTRHMKTHGRIGKDVYKCKFCLMPFSVPSTLEKHMRKCMENRQGPGALMGDMVEGDSDSSSMQDNSLDKRLSMPGMNCSSSLLNDQGSNFKQDSKDGSSTQENSLDKRFGMSGLNCSSGLVNDQGMNFKQETKDT